MVGPGITSVVTVNGYPDTPIGRLPNLELDADNAMSWQSAHNRLVAGSNSAGPTKFRLMNAALKARAET